MATFEQSEVLAAPVYRVVQAIEYVVRPHKPVVDHARGIAYVHSIETMQVYHWQLDPSGGTYLTHVLLPASPDVTATLRHANDVLASIRELPREIAQSDWDGAHRRFSRIVAATETPELFYDQESEEQELYLYPPYRPLVILLVSALFGLAGGVMAALNWRRLGAPQKVGGATASAIAYAAIVAVVLINNGNRLPGLVLALNFGLGVWFFRQQRPFYRRWLSDHDYNAPSLRVSGVSTLFLLVCVGVVFWGIASGMTPMTFAPANQRSATTVPATATRIPAPSTPLLLDFDLPDAWKLVEPSAPQLGCINSVTLRCLAVATREDRGAELAAYEPLASYLNILSLPDFERVVSGNFMRLRSFVTQTSAISARTLNGYPAIQRIGYWQDDARTKYLLIASEVGSYRHVVLVIVAPRPAFEALQPEIDSIIKSIQITD